jgi:hypothetical protein
VLVHTIDVVVGLCTAREAAVVFRSIGLWFQLSEGFISYLVVVHRQMVVQIAGGLEHLVTDLALEAS